MSIPNITKEEAREMVDEFVKVTNGFNGWVTKRYICMIIEGKFRDQLLRNPLDYMRLIEALEEKTNSYYVEKQQTNSHTSFYLFFRRHIFLETN